MFQAKKINGHPIVDVEINASSSIAAGVRMTAAHQALALQIKKFEAERAEALAEMRALIAGNSNERNDKAITRLYKKREALEQKLAPLRQEIRPLRDAHAEAVRKALRPRGIDASKTMIHALAEFTAAAVAFNQCEDTIEAAGGEILRLYIPVNIGAIEHFARSFVGGDK